MSNFLTYLFLGITQKKLRRTINVNSTSLRAFKSSLEGDLLKGGAQFVCCLSPFSFSFEPFQLSGNFSVLEGKLKRSPRNMFQIEQHTFSARERWEIKTRKRCLLGGGRPPTEPRMEGSRAEWGLALKVSIWGAYAGGGLECFHYRVGKSDTGCLFIAFTKFCTPVSQCQDR